MYNEVKLFIEGKEVEFSTTPQILYNYKVTDMQNPTTYINGRSKQIQVEGTPSNNDLFGHIWRLDRYQIYEGVGPSFNPIKRANFQLFVNGEIYERGYAKLDNIKKKGNAITYSITLYSGIGNMFFALTYLSDDSNRKMTLADLQYGEGIEPDLDFNITKETVNAAWNYLASPNYSDKWDIINFAVTSEGIPDDFDAAKVLINTLDYNTFERSKDGCAPIYNGATNSNGYVLAELPYDMTCDNTFDLRSYLLRPVVNIKRVLEAIKNPSINGGYELVFDSHFFHSTNPYYNNAWMTLPKLKDLKIESVDETTVTASISRTNHNNYAINYTSPLGASPSGVDLDINLTFNPSSSTSRTTLYTNSTIHTDASGGAWTTYVEDLTWTEGCIVQLFAYNGNGDEVERSNAYFISSYPNVAYDSTKKLSQSYTYKSGTNMKTLIGKFVKKNNTFVFCDNNGYTQPLTFHFENQKFSTLKLYVETPTSFDLLYTSGLGRTAREFHKDTTTNRMFWAQENSLSGRQTVGEVLSNTSITGTYGFTSNHMNINTYNYSSLFSGTKITKDKLLATEFTVCDLLVSYMKLFGLYAYQDPAEEPTNSTIYPNGVIHLCDREDFYDETIVNVHQQIDRGKDMTIIPAVAESKWYEFDVEPIGSEAQEKYESTYGYTYGRALLDTGMDFNRDTKELYEGNVFRSGVMVQEKNRYFNMKNNSLYPYAYNRMTYSLFKPTVDGFDSTSIEFPSKVLIPTSINSDGYEYFDSMPKLQVHGEDLGSCEGDCVLLFFDGMRNLVGENGQPVTYMLTDDVQDMADLNDGTPCYLLTNGANDAGGNSIAIFRNSLPCFTRDIIRGGNIVHTWNFGHPQETFVPDTYTTDFDCLYDKCWKNYLSDVYSVNSRKLTCKMRILGRPNPSWMRKFFAFDNVLWRLNEIKDWNLNTMETTQVEFIRVQDTNNYKLTKITNQGLIQVVFDSGIPVPYAGGTVRGRVIQQSSGSRWDFDQYLKSVDEGGTQELYPISSVASPTTGTARETSFTITVPPNPSGYVNTYEIKVIDADNNRVPAYFEQLGNTQPSIEFTPSTVSIPSTGGEYQFAFVYANVRLNSISASSTDSWIQVTGTDTVNNVVTAIISPNQSSSSRDGGRIIINAIGTNGAIVNNALTINQGGDSMVVYPMETSFDYWEDYTTDGHRFDIITDNNNVTVTINDI